jgi:TraB/PrgY/gumN family
MKFAWAVAVALLMALAPLARAEPPAAAVPDVATPSLWVVERGDTKLYLFGSLHLLPPQTKWTSEALDKARAEAQVFVFEAPLDQGGGAMARFVEKSGRLPFGQTLSTVSSARRGACSIRRSCWSRSGRGSRASISNSTATSKPGFRRTTASTM